MKIRGIELTEKHIGCKVIFKSTQPAHLRKHVNSLPNNAVLTITSWNDEIVFANFSEDRHNTFRGLNPNTLVWRK